jgi:hypothetical protein
MNEHPADRSDGDADRRLARLWRATAPADPGEDAWAHVLAQIEAHAARAPQLRAPRPSRRRFPVGALLLAGGLTAAAVLLAVALTRPWAGPEHVAPTPDVEPWSVATDDDVEILGMDAADLRALVVGQPPHRGPVELVSVDDVLIDDTGHDVEVRVTDTLRSGPTSSPMIIMPLEGLAGRQ